MDNDDDAGASAEKPSTRSPGGAQRRPTMVDPTLSHLKQLDPYIRRRAMIMLYAVRSAGIPLIITSSWRTTEQQAKLVLQGRSWTQDSAHLRGLAFDVDLYGWDRDDVPREFWDILGPWAETALGLRWGGSFSDYGHFEIDPPQRKLI